MDIFYLNLLIEYSASQILDALLAVKCIHALLVCVDQDVVVLRFVDRVNQLYFLGFLIESALLFCVINTGDLVVGDEHLIAFRQALGVALRGYLLLSLLGSAFFIFVSHTKRLR